MGGNGAATATRASSDLTSVGSGLDLGSGSGPARSVRLSHPEDLHLTLVFVGGVEPHLSDCVEAAGDDVACRAFDLELDRIQSWNAQRLWIAQPQQPPTALFELVSQLQQNLLVCGLEPEKRRYRPHLTLARKAPPLEPVPMRLHWPVSEFVLAASRSGQRPSYAIIQRWPLAH